LNGPRHHTQSHLFTIRLWVEEVDQGVLEWRGVIRHTLSGETHYFREWATMTAVLKEALSKMETDPNVRMMEIG
jgi:hypothetical protein